MNQYPFFAELILRLQMESPKFFKKFQTVFYVLAGLAQLFTGLRDFGFVFPPVIAATMSQSSAIILFLAGVLSTLPVKDTGLLRDKLEKRCGN
ncbi:MAG TPA: hypothetical protein VGM30_10565 [Puia sp.]|jgi:hypothetical protein